MSPIVAVIVLIVAVLAVAVVVLTLRQRRAQRHDVEAEQAAIAALPLLSEQDIAYRVGLEERPRQRDDGLTPEEMAAAAAIAARIGAAPPLATAPVAAAAAPVAAGAAP